MSGAGVTPTPATLQHDTKGNMTTDDRGTGMAWDFDNMLQSFSANGVSGLSNATYENDVIGRRVAKNVAQSGGGTATTLFVQASQQVVCEYTPANATTDSDRKYAYGTYIDEVLNLVDTTATDEVRYWLHPDRQYSVYAATGNLGATENLYKYDAYGIRRSAGQELAPWEIRGISYTGRSYDSESAFVFFRARIYDPRTGRFASRDPLKYVPGINSYAIMRSRPRTFVDPSGLIQQHPTGSVVSSDQLMGDPVFPKFPRLYPTADPILDPLEQIISPCEAAIAPFRNEYSELGQTDPAKASRQCNVNVFCGNCGKNGEGKPLGGNTFKDNGRVNICINKEAKPLTPEEYRKLEALVLHELVHAAQALSANPSLCKDKCWRGPNARPPNLSRPNHITAVMLQNCEAVERAAYEAQAQYAYPDDPVKRAQLVEAGICFSCEHLRPAGSPPCPEWPK